MNNEMVLGAHAKCQEWEFFSLNRSSRLKSEINIVTAKLCISREVISHGKIPLKYVTLMMLSCRIKCQLKIQCDLIVDYKLRVKYEDMTS